MATKPTAHAEWALQDLIDPINSLPNKQEPTTALKNSGANRVEPSTRQNINWLFNFNDQWNKWAEQSIDDLEATVSQTKKVSVNPATNLTLTRDLTGNYYYMTGNTITLANIITAGASTEQIGSVIKVRTTQSTTVSLNSGVTRVGFTGAIPADRIATFTIESLPSGTGTEWSCEISAGV